MPGTPGPDTPDYQVGVVNAQAPLATVPANTAAVTVGIPPNAETLVVVIEQQVQAFGVTCVGVTSNASFAVVPLPAPEGQGFASVIYCDVSNAFDTQATITFPLAPATTWYVYSDAGVHLTADMANLRNTDGQQYVIPSVPGLGANDHPPNDLGYNGTAIAVSTANFFGPPGAGKRYRVFSAWVSSEGAWVGALIVHGGAWLIASPPSGANSITYGPSGIPLPVNTGVDVNVGTGGNVAFGMAYTVETF